MTSDRIVGIATLVICSILVLFCGGKRGASIIICGIILLIIVILSRRYSAECSHGKLETPISVRKNQDIKITVELYKRGILPIFAGMLYVRTTNSANGVSQQKKILFHMILAEQKKITLHLESPYMGIIETKIEKIEIYDIFGFVIRETSLNIKRETRVMPSLVDIPFRTEPARRYEDFGEEVIQALRGWDPGYYDGIRAYQRGDSMKWIHWKLTGKTDDDNYLVKELGRPATIMPYLFLESAMIKKDPQEVDRLLEVYLSMAEKLIERGYIHMLVFLDSETGECITYEIKDMAYLEDALDLILRVKFTESSDVTIRYLSEESWQHCSQLVYIAKISEDNVRTVMDRISVPLTMMVNENDKWALYEKADQSLNDFL